MNEQNNTPPSVQSPVTPMQATVAPATVPLKYAGFWIRWIAAMVDGLVLGAGGFLAGFLVELVISGAIERVNNLVGQFISILISWIYYVWMTNSTQSTLGKMMVGLKVQSVDGQKLSFGKVVLRETIGKLISGIILGIGYIMAAFTEKKQGLHDFMAKSIVIYADPTKKHTTGLVIGIIIAALLPALAILGILSSVVLVSLNSTRIKGFDARIRADLASLVVEAETYYDTNTGYSGFCSNNGARIDPIIDSIIKSNLKTRNDVRCVDSKEHFVISAPYRSEGYGCVDDAPLVKDISMPPAGTSCR